MPEILEDNTDARGKTVIRKKTVSREAKLRSIDSRSMNLFADFRPDNVYPAE